MLAFGKGIRTAPSDALVADSTPQAGKGSTFGFHRVGTAGVMLGLVIAVGVVWFAQDAERSNSHTALQMKKSRIRQVIRLLF